MLEEPGVVQAGLSLVGQLVVGPGPDGRAVKRGPRLATFSLLLPSSFESQKPLPGFSSELAFCLDSDSHIAWSLGAALLLRAPKELEVYTYHFQEMKCLSL